MTHQFKRILFPILSFMTLVALACTCGGGTSGLATTVPDTAVPPPTKAAPPTKPAIEVPTQAEVPTKPPIGGNNGGNGGNSGSGSLTIELSSDTYTHSSGAFTTGFPNGWTKKDRQDGVDFTEPNGAAAVYISFTNVGVQLDDTGLGNYANNIENNWFAGYKNYSANKPEKQKDGSILIAKTLTDSNNNDYKVYSYYTPVGKSVYEQDFWALTKDFDSVADSFVQIANTLKTDDTAVDKEALYYTRWTFQCPNKLCQFDVPYGWAWNRDDKTYKNTLNDKFTSPDQRSYIDSTVYDDGTAVSKSDSGAFALSLLKQFYANDVKITDDKVQSDGSERLDWNSASGGYEGESFFETRGTTFLMWTWVVSTDYYDVYTNLWGDIVNSYKVP